MDIVDQLAPRGFDCVCGNIRMAARAVTSIYDRHLRGAGVSATMIRNLRGLERQGWVSLAVGTDRRRRLPALTEKGRAVFAEALPLWKKAQQEVGALLDDKLSETNRKLVRLTRAIA